MDKNWWCYEICEVQQFSIFILERSNSIQNNFLLRQVVIITFSVGPSGVVWAVDKKETVPNHPMSRWLSCYWKKAAVYFFLSKVWRRLGSKNMSIIGTKWQSVTGRSQSHLTWIWHFNHTHFKACIHFCWPSRSVGHLAQEWGEHWTILFSQKQIWRGRWCTEMALLTFPAMLKAQAGQRYDDGCFFSLQQLLSSQRWMGWWCGLPAATG